MNQEVDKEQGLTLFKFQQTVYSPDYEGIGYLEHTLSEFDDNLLEDILHLIDNGEFDVY